ncbi:RNA polymerase sigma factor [Nocardia alba]|uniref:RNA polymerase sigma factor (Sigma-70 family) n=1 Tax=Nocardia alba TaxID=225051 RepID=A0A4R1F7Q1_9NOCA|nr:sigma-70 family RNA polymerase sigma factor [Nocardia alba]TCJ89973.1 RNA polymerase sigma factor (sigma-70 family) [Nocardia alba]
MALVAMKAGDDGQEPLSTYPPGSPEHTVDEPEQDPQATTLREEQERRDRLKGDAELFDLIRADGFAGRRWNQVQTEMAHYGIGVLRSWAAQGFLAAKLAQHSQLRLTVGEMQMFERDPDFREGLFDAAVTEALADFRVRGLQGTGWDAARGAAITTYFTRSCLFKLGNELRRQRRSDSRYRREIDAALQEAAASPDNDVWADEPYRMVIDSEIVSAHLDELSAEDRKIVVGKAFRYSVAEIAELHEIPERVVRRRWTWLVKNVDWIRRLGDRGEL